MKNLVILVYKEYLINVLNVMYMSSKTESLK